MSRLSQISETQRKRSVQQRMMIIEAIFCICLLIIVARLIELQVVKADEYKQQAESQHFGDIKLGVRRGEILSLNSKTGETSILATNTTLNMVYVDPIEVDTPSYVADTLANIVVNQEVYDYCKAGKVQCPREITSYFAAAFDPLGQLSLSSTGALLEPIPSKPLPIDNESIPDLTEVRRLFAAQIERKISETRVTYVPIVYGADKLQMTKIEELGIPGVTVSKDQRLIYANPEELNQLQLPATARKLAQALDMDSERLRRILRSRPLRYVPVMRRLDPDVSAIIREAMLQSEKETQQKKINAPNREVARDIKDPLRSVVLRPESWRFYPDSEVASQVIGFVNDQSEAQYGIERSFDLQLKGKEGRIRSMSDRTGGQILTGSQTFEDAQHGASYVLTIDRFVQKRVEEIMQDKLEEFQAESGQAIIMDPFTGRITAMVNVPKFDSNYYGEVYDKDLLFIEDRKYESIIVELYHPQTNEFILRAFYDQLFTEQGRKDLSEELQKKLADIEKLYKIEDVVRYYYYIGEYNRWEIFPTDSKNVWLKFKNNIGVGSYLNKVIQEIYEPGSVLKALTMAIAIDQGEITPLDTYFDTGTIEVDEYTIHNSLNAQYGEVTMTNCLEYSINTCMTMVSGKLGRKLFHRMLSQFGFGSTTGIELEDELPGELRPWRKWSRSELATHGFGQGISATPLQVVTSFAALANGGKLFRPTIVDSIIQADGTVENIKPHVVDQVIKKETSETITAMLVSTVSRGFARTAKPKLYKVAGKTGTSQIAGPGGRYETGTGSTRTTFAGFAPVDNPKFVMLVKFDRPKAKDIEYGSQTAAPVFREIAEFLFQYYGIPPDDI